MYDHKNYVFWTINVAVLMKTLTQDMRIAVKECRRVVTIRLQDTQSPVCKLIRCFLVFGHILTRIDEYAEEMPVLDH